MVILGYWEISQLKNYSRNLFKQRISHNLQTFILSVSSRSPETGLYHNLQKYNLPYPEAIFDIEYFRYDSRPFDNLGQSLKSNWQIQLLPRQWKWFISFFAARELYPGRKYRPNEAHFFVKLLQDQGRLLKVYTQNIDGLERRQLGSFAFQIQFCEFGNLVE